ncbi:MAG: hypothetical protein ACJAT6_000488 [Akkermansiaceae bacterium]|jgi:hypothetical protein|tara:strand:+ start:1756 stop:3699 length:1944 start_codon:yes stop_codon:yes gene_type:complete
MVFHRIIGYLGITIGSLLGAEDYWAFASVLNPAPPAIQNVKWAREELDRFILAGIERADYHPTQTAAKRTLVRRAYLDLHGLPPSIEQITAFLEDRHDDAWAKLIDELLASPRYGERWGRHWLDVARYADTNGMDEDIAHPSAWRYRDYVIASFNKDKPFDQFIVEQLAGDLLPAKDLTEKRARTVGLGFLSVGPKMLACDDPDKMRRDIVDEQMDTTGRAFLGMTIGCARCHDHKIDPISIQDYYGLAGIFMSTKTLTKYSVVAEFHEHDLTKESDKKKHQEVQRLEAERKKKETSKDEKERLGKEITTLKKDLPALFKVMGVTERPTQNVKVHLRGDYLTLGEEVPRGVPSAWTNGKKITMPKKKSGRLELARWIASSENPLTSRVIVNRLWRWHFGRGIVPTPDNFGGLGEPPTHPKLLDHLATRFMKSGWSIKAMHRLIMNSTTYRQSAQADLSLLKYDPENKLFARWQRRRVESEVIRDSILMKSKRLDPTMGGSMLVVKTSKYADRSQLKAHSLAPRRTVYLPVYRSAGYDGQKAFDAADPAVPDGNRRTSTVAGQALYLMNSELMHESSRALAKILTSSIPSQNSRDRTSWLIEHLLGRESTEKERLQGEKFVNNYSDQKEAWAAFARVLFSSNEFLYVE